MFHWKSLFNFSVSGICCCGKILSLQKKSVVVEKYFHSRRSRDNFPVPEEVEEEEEAKILHPVLALSASPLVSIRIVPIHHENNVTANNNISSLLPIIRLPLVEKFDYFHPILTDNSTWQDRIIRLFSPYGQDRISPRLMNSQINEDANSTWNMPLTHSLRDHLYLDVFGYLDECPISPTTATHTTHSSERLENHVSSFHSTALIFPVTINYL